MWTDLTSDHELTVAAFSQMSGGLSADLTEIRLEMLSICFLVVVILTPKMEKYFQVNLELLGWGLWLPSLKESK